MRRFLTAKKWERLNLVSVKWKNVYSVRGLNQSGHESDHSLCWENCSAWHSLQHVISICDKVLWDLGHLLLLGLLLLHLLLDGSHSLLLNSHGQLLLNHHVRLDLRLRLRLLLNHTSVARL